MDRLIKKCLHCGTSLSQLRETRKAGCSLCYNTFDEEIDRMNGDFSSAGEKKDLDSEGIRSLKNRLEQALLSEDYEMAARLRDELAGITGDELPKGK